MNWTNFQTYNEAPTRSFEILCNQLFENWCKEEYKAKIVSFSIVNGAGGDGGVESYAVLTNGAIVGLQAKWFLSSIAQSQFNQIKSSIKTALDNRPEITRYIVCIPRDLTSTTARSKNSEERRWNRLKEEVLKSYPNLEIELWNETRITSELQKNSSDGIYKFWFENAEIAEEVLKLSFDKCKKSWLSERYVPELNTFGKIDHFLSLYLGNKKRSKNFLKRLKE